MKKVLLLATGGTIAATGRDVNDHTHYRYGDLMVDSLIASSPGLSGIAEVTAVDLCQIGSENMTFAVWLDLARRLTELLPDFDAAVITHGTDTMEETSFWLNLVLKTDKPVVLTGAMRPATSLSADGPGNLVDALRVAVDDSAAGLGVLCVLGGEIWSAAAVRKNDVGSLQAFSGGSEPPLGRVNDTAVSLEQRPLLPHTLALPFDLSVIRELPPVDLLYVCAGMTAPAIVRPTVAAAFGLGTLPDWVRQQLAESGQPVLIAGQSEKGRVIKLYQELPVVNLTPRKARVLLATALAQGWTTEQVMDSLEIFA